MYYLYALVNTTLYDCVYSTDFLLSFLLSKSAATILKSKTTINS